MDKSLRRNAASGAFHPDECARRGKRTAARRAPSSPPAPLARADARPARRSHVFSARGRMRAAFSALRSRCGQVGRPGARAPLSPARSRRRK